MQKQKVKKVAMIVAICIAAVVVFLSFDVAAFAQAGAGGSGGDSFKSLAEQAKSQGWRAGRGMSLCPIKIAILIVFYISWVATAGWVNNDAERLGDPDRIRWNATFLITFPVATVLAIMIPIFWLGLPIVILAWIIPSWIYVHSRNKGMLDADKVMTPSHLAFWFRTKVLRQEVKPKKLPYEGGAPCQLEAYAPSEDESVGLSRTVNARNRATLGYNYLRELLYHALKARATDVVIEFGPEETNFQYQIDGVYHPITDAFRKPWLREEADVVAEAAKYIIGGKPENRTGRQSGMFRILYDRSKKGKPLHCEAKINTAGTPSGEVFKITFIFEKASFRRLSELGTSPERKDLIRRLINAENGLVIISSAPHHGLKTLTTVIFNSADRFTRDFAGVEDVQNEYEDIENIQNTRYDSAKGETPMTVLPDVFFKEPKVLLIRDMVNLEAWKLCCEEVANDRLIITTLRAFDAVGTIIRALEMGVDKELLANTLTAIISQRLIRRLCEDCREETEVTNPRIVSAFGLDPKRPIWYVPHLHEPVAPGERDYYIPCTECREIGYMGRAALFDILEVNDEMRQIIAADASLREKEVALRRKALESGQEGYLTDGKRLVREGVTSYDEVRRIITPPTNQRRTANRPAQ
ncbi:MAG: ATPase, T2SS/T4P/T4SS family [Thermoguttaceae bacterium]|jgi:type II secretory ATPase GspE/PulE/Tfp pilus assembly ATPase PilB-like protein